MNVIFFLGESVDDCGGGYSESIAEMCEELQNGSVPLLMATPNGRGDAGASRDAFLLNPISATPLHLNCFRFLGIVYNFINMQLMYCIFYMKSVEFKNAAAPCDFFSYSF